MQDLCPILVVTRPAPKGPAFATAVTEGLDPRPRVILSPAFDIRPTGAAVPEGDVVFTSATAVDLAPDGRGTAWCVGDATARAATARGWDARSAGGDADSLVALILSERPAGALTHLAGAHRRGQVSERLTAAGVACVTVVLYAQERLSPTPELMVAARGTVPLVAPVFSVRSAAGLAVPGRVAPLHVVAIAAAVAEAARILGTESVLTAERPDAVHMLAATKSVLCRVHGP